MTTALDPLGSGVAELPAPATTAPSLTLVRPPRFLGYGDVMRILGGLAVVLVHVAQDGTRQFATLSAPQWWCCSLLDAAGRWAVPVFIMLSGAIFLDPDRTEPARKFYHRRWLRLAPAMAFWLVFFLIWETRFNHVTLAAKDVLRLILDGTTCIHLHFLAVVAGLYLFTPMLRIYLAHAPVRQVWSATALVLGLSVIGTSIQYFKGIDVLEDANLFNRFVPYLGFYLAGYCLRHATIKGWHLAAAWAGLLLSILLTAVGARWMINWLGMDHGGMYFYSQLSPTRPLMAICVFLIIASHWPRPRNGIPPRNDPGSRNARNGALARAMRHLATATLGIYLIHPIFLDLLYRGGIYSTVPSVWVGTPLRLALAYLASAIVTLILLEIPYVRALVGGKD